MVPRPATERLVDAALARLDGRPARVADVGSGSGAIAVALAVKKPLVEVWASDVSEDAVELTRANADRLGVADRVHVRAGELLEPLPGRFDLILANLPYLPDALAGEPAYAEYASEPAGAIYAPGDGLGPYRRLLAEAGQRLAPGGAVVLQLHRDMLEADRDGLASLLTELDAEAPTRRRRPSGRAGSARATV
jgi:release factor glutamine methyltransferase